MKRAIKLFLPTIVIFLLAACSSYYDLPGGGSGDFCDGACGSGQECRDDNDDGDYICESTGNGNGTDACGNHCGQGQQCVTHGDGSSTCESTGGGGGSCANVTCGAGQYCSNGQCVDDLDSCALVDCAAGSTCQNGQCVNDGTTTPPVNTTPVTFRVFTPGGQQMERIDFNYCVSSTTENPSQCYAWTEPGGIAEDSNYIDVILHLPSYGVVRFNASYYTNENAGPSNWLCYGSSNPQLTAEVEIYTPSTSYGTSAVDRTAFSSGGCSAYVVIDNIL